jgi:nucleotidyltransferase substrate binding protein (TIGR01987 family)
MATESRWILRFKNFEKSYKFFKSIIEREDFSHLEIAGLIKSFEFTYEIAWKTIKDYLEEQGIPTNFPREAIKEGFRTQIIGDGHTWLQMLEKRNELAHTYNEEIADDAVDAIRNKFFPAITQVYQYFKDKCE